jgi:glucose-specific phosphotransferase system IIA component
MFFKKRVAVYNPFEGKTVSLDSLPDPVFSQRMMGDGVAVVPDNNQCRSPVDGAVATVFPTKHAIVIRTKEGLEVLIHIGLDTVQLQGEGFELHVKAGQQVTKGQLLITFDRETIGEQKPLLSPVIVTNLAEINGKVEPAKESELYRVVFK